MLKRLPSIIILALLICGGLLYFGYTRERARRLTAQSELIKTKLLAAGYHEGLVKRDLERNAAPEIRPLVTAAKKAGATPAIVTKTVYKEVNVLIPCDNPTEIVDTTLSPTTLPPTHVHVAHMSADSYSTLALLPNGAPLFGTRLFLNISNGDKQRIELEPEYQKSSIELSEEVKRAFTYWNNRPPRISLTPRPLDYWRIGPVVGVGGIINPVTGRVNAGVFAGIGIEF